MRDFKGFYADVVVYLLSTSNIPIYEISRNAHISMLRLIMVKYRLIEPFISDVYDIQRALNISDKSLEKIVDDIRNESINQNIQ